MSSHTNALIPVAVHGAPRSGTTWIGEIINSSPNTLYRYQPLFSYAHKDFLTPTSSREEIDNFFIRLQNCNDDFTLQLHKRQEGTLPIFQKEEITHIVYKEVRYHNILLNLMREKHDLRLVAIIRNPLSVINSWLKAPREFRADLGWDILEEWRAATKKNLDKPEEFNGFEKWKEATQLFLKLKTEYPERVHLIRYSTYLSNPTDETKKLFRFLMLDFSEQTVNFIKDSTRLDNLDPYSVYKAHQSDNSWRKELPQTISKHIQNDLQGSDLETFLV